ncbi:hypothetical protein LTR67_000880 [Exophiala xenobiotica]
MAPPRPLKRQKTNPTEGAPSVQNDPADVPLPPDTPARPFTPKPSSSPEEGKRSSWITRTWPRKARPLAEIARESVSSASNAAQELASITKDKARSQRSPSLAMALGKTTSNRSLPVDATTTTVNATADSTIRNSKKKPEAQANGKKSEEVAADKPVKEQGQKPEDTDGGGATVPPIPPATEATMPEQGNNTQGTWLGWLAKRDGTATKPTDVQQPPSLTTEAEVTSPPSASNAGESFQPPSEPPRQDNEVPGNASNKRSWYQMWSSDAPSEPTKEAPSIPATKATTSSTSEATKQAKNLDIPVPETPKSKSTSKASSIETSPPPPLTGDGSKSSGWVFWSRDRKGQASARSDNETHVGEIAISDTPSQAKPKRASISLHDDAARPVLKPSQQEELSKKAMAERTPTTRTAATEQPQPQNSQKKTTMIKDGKSTKAESSNATAVAREPVELGTSRQASPAPSKKEMPNLLLPPIGETLTYEEQPSILQQLARMLYYTKEPHLKHLSVVKDPPRIKNALAIGVHGYFPAPLIRTMLGQPTGTSIKFADMAAKCIRKWTRSRGYDCEVKSAALEGEGRIAERVELLWKLLLNWIDEIRKSDFVMIACHSQGVPVAIMLVAKLIQFGCISGARVGICAMAGVNMGPFPEYKSRWISGTAGELFEFSDPNSKVSMRYLEAMEVVLKFGVRLTFVGSIDDQLVSMESSIFAPVTHPHIYRAVFIDSRVHAPNFLSHLVGFALKLRNVGVPDHGLIRELSSPLAGSLYGGEGHSRIYEEDAVYDIAVSFALETSALKDVPISKRQTSNTMANPYVLPFAMRGILEEDYVKTELQNEAQELLAQFDDWKPTTKALKDVKFRLEGIRSKL